MGAECAETIQYIGITCVSTEPVKQRWFFNMVWTDVKPDHYDHNKHNEYVRNTKLELTLLERETAILVDIWITPRLSPKLIGCLLV